MVGAPARARASAPLVLALAAGLGLAACSGDTGAEKPSPSASSSNGESLTAQGSKLHFGDTARVGYRPKGQSRTTLELTVREPDLGSTKDFSGFILDDRAKASTPYYVEVTVKNVGDGDVGGRPVPVWGVDKRNVLLPAATFTTSFPKCPSKPLPSTFGAGDTYRGCLVFLAPDHGSMRAVSYRPEQEFDPIEWTGPVASPSSGSPSAGGSTGPAHPSPSER